MKIRSDFVTNSSSSSFIISTKDELPDKYKENIDKISGQNISEILRRHTGTYINDEISSGVSYDEFKKLGNFTDEQMSLIQLIECECMQLYMDMKTRIDSGQDLYNIYVDRDWLYENAELKKFINESELIDEEGDL